MTFIHTFSVKTSLERRGSKYELGRSVSRINILGKHISGFCFIDIRSDLPLEGNIKCESPDLIDGVIESKVTLGRLTSLRGLPSSH